MLDRAACCVRDKFYEAGFKQIDICDRTSKSDLRLNVEEDMGPTSIVPRTHTAEAHERFNTRDDGGRERIALLREYPNHIGVLKAGDANLIDSRLIHAGGANDSMKRRVLFYFSFRRRGKVTG